MLTEDRTPRVSLLAHAGGAQGSTHASFLQEEEPDVQLSRASHHSTTSRASRVTRCGVLSCLLVCCMLHVTLLDLTTPRLLCHHPPPPHLLIRFCDDGPRGQFGRSEQIYEQAILRRHLAGNHLTFVRTIAACTHPHLHPHARAHLACVLVCFIVARTRIYCIYMSHDSCRYESGHH
jgi:hypothetical protein